MAAQSAAEAARVNGAANTMTDMELLLRGDGVGTAQTPDIDAEMARRERRPDGGMDDVYGGSHGMRHVTSPPQKKNASASAAAAAAAAATSSLSSGDEEEDVEDTAEDIAAAAATAKRVALAKRAARRAAKLAAAAAATVPSDKDVDSAAAKRSAPSDGDDDKAQKLPSKPRKKKARTEAPAKAKAAGGFTLASKVAPKPKPTPKAKQAAKPKTMPKTKPKPKAATFLDLSAGEGSDDSDKSAGEEGAGVYADEDIAAGRHKNSEWRNRYGRRSDTEDTDDSGVVSDDHVSFMSSDSDDVLDDVAEEAAAKKAKQAATVASRHARALQAMDSDSDPDSGSDDTHRRTKPNPAFAQKTKTKPKSKAAKAKAKAKAAKPTKPAKAKAAKPATPAKAAKAAKPTKPTPADALGDLLGSSDDDDDDAADVDASGVAMAAAAVERQPAVMRVAGAGDKRRVPHAKAKAAEVIRAWTSPALDAIVLNPTSWDMNARVLAGFFDNVRPIVPCESPYDDPERKVFPGWGDVGGTTAPQIMLGHLLRIARYVLTPACAAATDAQMLHILTQMPAEIGTSIQKTNGELFARLSVNINKTGGSESPFLAIASAMMAAVCLIVPHTMPETAPKDEDVPYKCTWTQRVLIPGERVWIVAPYNHKQGILQPFYIGTHPRQPNFYIVMVRAMRTFQRWNILFMQHIMRWQCDARLPSTLSADMRFQSFVTAHTSIKTCTDALCDFFAARHLAFSHVDT